MKTNNIDNELNWDIATKVLSGEANKNEQLYIEDWINQSPSNKVEWEQIASGLFETDKAMLTKQINVDDAYTKVKSQINKSKLKHRFAYVFAAAAAILLLVGIFSVFYSNNIETIATSNLVVEQYQLPDGSVVDINKNSSISIDNTFNKNERRVSLSGEAFFQVKRNTSSPFTIDIGDIKVKVLGTSFNIKETKNQTAVTVASGTVEVFKSNNEDDAYYLTAGDKIYYNRISHKLIKVKNTDNNFIAWKTKKLKFKKEPLNDAIALIEDIYDVEIVLPENFNSEEAQISATFNQSNIDFICDVISKTFNISVSFVSSSKTSI